MKQDELTMATGVPGLFVFGPMFEELIDALQRELNTRAGQDGLVGLGIQPVISRETLERGGYVESFPHLLGTVHTYEGSEQEWRALAGEMKAGRDWSSEHQMSDVAVLPAACYQVYPLFDGAELDSTQLVDVTGRCYRHERSHELGRMRSFRMREFVCVGEAGDAIARREAWLESAREWLSSLGLDISIEVATDPFFGGTSKLMKPLQKSEHLKLELLAPLDAGTRQAIASSNYHKGHFGSAFNICAGGETAHSACAAFGLERIALAIVHAHGDSPENWPVSPGSTKEIRV